MTQQESAPDALLERLSRRPKAPMDTIRKMDGELNIIDVLCSDHIEWRQARLAIDMREGRWMHFSFLPKEEGRTTEELAHCSVIQSQLAAKLNQLFQVIFPDRDSSTLNYTSEIRSHFTWEDDTCTTSFHGNAKSQKKVRDLSNHDWANLINAWNRIIETEAQRRRLPAT